MMNQKNIELKLLNYQQVVQLKLKIIILKMKI